MKLDDRLVADTKGFLDEDEGRRLYEVALKASQMGPCLEIGSYCGKSAIYLGTACRKNNGILFSIDHHRGSEEQQPGEEYFDPDLLDEKTGRINTFEFFRTTIESAGLTETLVPIVCPSAVAARLWATPLSMVFIDGGHAYETVYTDYLSWADHIMTDGYLLIHDIFENPDEGGQAPYEVYQLALASNRFRTLPMTKTLGVLQKIGTP